MKDIILPVQHSLPAGKFVLAVRLSRLFRANIHLVGLMNDSENESGDEFFLKACQLFQNSTNLEVKCMLVKGSNLARATMEYGLMIKSGLILVCNARKSMAQVVAYLLLTRPVSAVRRIPLMIVPVEQLHIE
ncbi:hypothetical protein ACQ86N_15900 [Puia sp. P3]|uniref:hypothetical protein n=1 Tax=Puia sp. P3 TaxID=3423952 RepID=UPI003D673241